MIHRLWRAATRNAARTSDQPADPRLRGRAYDLPFQQVWRAVGSLARARRGWTVVEEQPARGRLRAEARTTVFGFLDDVEVQLRLDDHGRTRVDLRSASRVGRGDLGANARRIGRFLRALDAELADGGGRARR